MLAAATLALLCLALLTSTGPASAQLGPPGQGSGPIDVSADQGIEWHQDIKAYVARGRAKAIRGTTTITADVLTAYYRETKDKGNDVFRLVAEGNVHVVSPNQEVFGDRGVYDADRKLSVITGKNLKLLTKTEVVTARDALEYYENDRLAVARGDAIAVRGDRQMRADILIARFAEGAGGKLDLERIDGDGNVLVTTPTDVARSKRLMYSVATEVAVLTGDVHITRDGNQINGEAAEMNTKTKVNRVLSSGQRTQALLVSKNAVPAPASGTNPASPAPASPAPANTNPASTNPAGAAPAGTPKAPATGPAP